MEENNTSMFLKIVNTNDSYKYIGKCNTNKYIAITKKKNSNKNPEDANNKTN